MKKLICAILCVVMLLGLAAPVFADVVTYTNVELYYTNDSRFEAGGTVTIDAGKTMMDGDILSEAYTALLEGTVQYFWYRNDSFYKDGKSLVLTDADMGCSFYCLAALYSDMDRTQQFGAIKSAKFTVPNTGNPALIPEITTENLPDATVGQSYYLKLECTNGDVTYSMFRSSLPDGLYLTQHGEIEGTPTKAGFWYVVIMATPVELGEDYATTAEYEFTVREAEVEEYSMEIMREPNKMHYKYGETLDLTGMWVRIYTPEGYLDSYDGQYLTYPTNPLVTPGDRKISVTYKDAIAIFLIVVDPAPEETTEATTEVTTVPEETTTATEAATEEVTEATKEATVGVTTDPTEEELPQILDGPGSEGPSNSGEWIIWLVIGICGLLIVAAAAVIVIVIVSKRKKAG